MARSPSSPIILPCPAKRVSAFSVVDGSVYRPPYQVRPFARPEHRQLGPPGIKTLHSLFTPLEKRRSSRLNDQTLSGGAFPAATASCPPHADCGRIVMLSGEAVNNPSQSALCGLVFDFG